MHGKFFASVLLATLIGVISALVEFDNQVTGTPIIECERDYIKFTVSTKKKFNGKVYVKGEYANSDCVRNYALYHRTGSYGNTVEAVSRADDFQYGGVPQDNGFGEQFLSSSASDTSGSLKYGRFGDNGATGSNGHGKVTSDGGKQPHFFKGQRPSVTKALENRNAASSSSNGFENGGNNRMGANGKSGGVKSKASNGYGSSGQSYDQFGSNFNGASGQHSGQNQNFPRKSGQSQRESYSHQKYPSFAHGGHDESDYEHEHASQKKSYTKPSFGYGLSEPPIFSTFHVFPNANGECPLTCPPCASCDHPSKDLPKNFENLLILRPRRSHDDSDSSVSLIVKLGTCNARRDRTVNPSGIHISFTAVVSFHENFVTKVDKAYHISCSYEEVDRTVFTQIEVSAPPEVKLEGIVEPPQCRYRISRPNGDPVRDVNVGTQIEHQWECSSPNGYDRIHEVYGLLVHNCYVEDGRGRRELVIDDKGCSVQPLVIGTPVYSQNSMSATIQSLVVKFPDRDTLDFQCSFYSCLKADSGCQAVTPPKCDGTRSRRSVDFNGTTIPLFKEWKLHAPRLHVMDIDTDIKQSEIDEIQALASLPPQPLVQNYFKELCVSVMSFGFIIASSTFLITVSLIVLIGLAFFRSKFSLRDHKTEHAMCSCGHLDKRVKQCVGRPHTAWLPLWTLSESVKKNPENVPVFN